MFAYGQTGSGKTYTIGEIANLGSVREGVAHRMIRALFGLAAQERQSSSMECTPRRQLRGSGSVPARPVASDG